LGKVCAIPRAEKWLAPFEEGYSESGWHLFEGGTARRGWAIAHFLKVVGTFLRVGTFRERVGDRTPLESGWHLFREAPLGRVWAIAPAQKWLAPFPSQRFSERRRLSIAIAASAKPANADDEVPSFSEATT
jgi:hypothetical protein